MGQEQVAAGSVGKDERIARKEVQGVFTGDLDGFIGQAFNRHAFGGQRKIGRWNEVAAFAGRGRGTRSDDPQVFLQLRQHNGQRL